MDRGKNQMPGESGLDGDLGRLTIADFANQDDVRVVTEKGAQGGWKVDAGRLIGLNLRHVLEVVFDRVFDRDDLKVGRGQHLKAGIECGGLARTGWTGDEKESVPRLHDPLQFRTMGRREP